MALIVLERIARALFDSFVMFAIVAGIIALFRIKNPTVRVSLYLVAIFRPILLLVDGWRFTHPVDKSFVFMLRVITDPFNVLNAGRTLYEPFAVHSADYTTNAIKTLVFIAVALISFRLLQLAVFYARFKRAPKVDSPRQVELDGITMELAESAGIRKPRVVVVDTPFVTPFVVGVIGPTIVVSRVFLKDSTPQVLKTAIAHEVSHVRRRDNTLRWFALVGRGIMFFSPFARLAFWRIEQEMEKACDSMAAKFSGKTPQEVGRVLVEIAELYHTLKVRPLPLRSGIAGMAGRKGIFKSRVEQLAKGGVPTSISLFKKIGFIFGCIPLIFFHVGFGLNVGGRIWVF
ncbi:MAG: M56 family metallopeptidase [Candidatus Aquicultorales bacterium]